MEARGVRAGMVPTAAGLTALVAVLVLAGWFWNIGAIKQILPGLVSMNPMTAVGFVLAAVSLWLQQDATAAAPGSRKLRVARFAALAIMAIGLLRLAAVLLGWDAGVDQWLFADRLDDGTGTPNRMAPNTALNFVLMGLALITLDVNTRRGRRPAELLASAVFLLGLLALAGYAYRVPELTGVARFIPMALHTAALFLVLALGVLAARPDAGLMAVISGPSPGGAMARLLLPAMVLALLALGWLRLEGERRGYYGAGLGVALYTLTNIIVFGALIGWSANSLHHADAARARLATQQRESEAQVRLLLDSTAEAIYGIDADGHCTFINRACVRMLGYTDSGELLGKDMHALIHHTRRDGTPYPPAECPIYQAVRTATPTHVDNEMFWRADGTCFAAEYWSHPMRRDGALVGAVVTFLDITARREAEERLQEALAFNRLIMDNSPDVICAINGDNRFVEISAASQHLWGYAPSELLGRDYNALVHADDRDKTSVAAAAIMAGEPMVGFTNRYIAKDGRAIDVDWSAVWSEADQLMFCVARDATERKRAADSILELNAELSANAVQLQQTNRELEAFSYTVSHDLRAPLRHIDGYARMLQEDAAEHLDADMRRYLDTISASARQMGALIDDLLAFSRLGRKPVERTEVDMGALVEHVLQEIGAGARVDVGQLPTVQGDPVLLKQVWINLISNAIKYSAPRAEAARIEVTGESINGVARYRIRDNGVGFDMRYADKLFGVFQRLHSQEEFEGTGVGLAIVHRVVVRHGGTISAESQPRQGATFTFELPITAQDPPAGTTDPTLFATETHA